MQCHFSWTEFQQGPSRRKEIRELITRTGTAYVVHGFFLLPQWSFQKVEYRKWAMPTKYHADFSYTYPVAKHKSVLDWHMPIKLCWEKVKTIDIVLFSAPYMYEKILKHPPLLPFNFTTTSLRFSNELKKCGMLGQGLNIKNYKNNYFFPFPILITGGFIFLFSLSVRMSLLSIFGLHADTVAVSHNLLII